MDSIVFIGDEGEDIKTKPSTSICNSTATCTSVSTSSISNSNPVVVKPSAVSENQKLSSDSVTSKSELVNAVPTKSSSTSTGTRKLSSAAVSVAAPFTTMSSAATTTTSSSSASAVSVSGKKLSSSDVTTSSSSSIAPTTTRSSAIAVSTKLSSDAVPLKLSSTATTTTPSPAITSATAPTTTTPTTSTAITVSTKLSSDAVPLKLSSTATTTTPSPATTSAAATKSLSSSSVIKSNADGVATKSSSAADPTAHTSSSAACVTSNALVATATPAPTKSSVAVPSITAHQVSSKLSSSPTPFSSTACGIPVSSVLPSRSSDVPSIITSSVSSKIPSSPTPFSGSACKPSVSSALSSSSSSLKRKVIKLSIKSSKTSSNSSITLNGNIPDDASSLTSKKIKKTVEDEVKVSSAKSATTVPIATGLKQQDSMDFDMLKDISTEDYDNFDSQFITSTFEEMQSSEIEQIKGYLLNPKYGDMSSKKRNGWKKKKVDYLLSINSIGSNLLKSKVTLFSFETDKAGERIQLVGTVSDIVYDAKSRLMWVVHFSQPGVVTHHRYCSVETMDCIVNGMQTNKLAISSTKINTYEKEFRSQKGFNPVELTLEPNIGCQSITGSGDNTSEQSSNVSRNTKNNNCTSKTNSKGTIDGYSVTGSNTIFERDPIPHPSSDMRIVSPIPKPDASILFHHSPTDNNGRCRICRCVLLTESSSEVEEKVKSNANSMYIAFKREQQLCIKCSVDIYQYERKHEANKLLLRLVHSKIIKWKWKNTTNVGVFDFLEREEYKLKELSFVYREAASSFPLVFPTSINVSCIDRRDKKGVLRQKAFLRDRKKYTESLNGAEFNSVSEYEDVLKNAVGLTDLNDGYVGFILLPGQNYITIMNGKFSATDIVNQAVLQTTEINKTSKMKKRAGSALGFVTSSSLCSSLPNSCSATLLPSSRGVSVNVTWKSTQDGKQKLFRGVYADGFLNHQTSNSKMKEMKRSTFLQNLLIGRGISRVVTALLLEHFAIDSSNTALKLLQWINNDLEKNKSRTKNSSSFIRMCESLCRYMCSFGRSNNFQALAAHTDGNYVSKMETILINGRVQKEDVEKAKQILQAKHLTDDCYEHVRMNMKDGYLFLPLDGIVLRMRGGVDVINCNLDDTIHIPDLSRNTVNFSVVEGGCDND